MPTKSDYTHRITNINGYGVIIIEDLNKGNMSVTNNIENVVEEIFKKEKVIAEDSFMLGQWLIIYKDSEGTWDGYDYARKVFVALAEKNYRIAIDTYLQIVQAK